MSEQKNKKVFFYDDHKKPRTRRDFLKMGLISYSGSVFAPTVLGLLTGAFKAHGQMAPGLEAANMKKAVAAEIAGSSIPFLVFDMAGGAALPGNFLVGKQGGPEDMLSSYDTLGWNPKGANALDKRFGLPMAANNVSGILRGILETASQQAQANLKMGSICNFSLDDQQTNRTSALTLVSKAGLRGTYLPTGLGFRNSDSGANSDVALKDPTLRPLALGSVNDLLNALSAAGPAFQNFSDEQIQAIGKALQNVSSQQLNSFLELEQGEQFKALAEAGYAKNATYGRTVPGIDPRQENDFRQIYGIAQNNDNGMNGISAAITMNVLKGNVGPGAIELGGCDYHSGSNEPGDQKDREMGQQIGRAVEAAFRLKKPLFFQLITDGGCGANPGTRNWSSDSSIRSMTVIGYYNPDKAPEQRRLQVGHYTDGQVVDQTTLLGGDPAMAAYGVLVNYLSACGRVGDYEKVLPAGVFTKEQVDSMLIF